MYRYDELENNIPNNRKDMTLGTKKGHLGENSSDDDDDDDDDWHFLQEDLKNS